MPEIGEVARVVHYIHKHVVGRRVVNTLVQEDDIVYGKVGTSAQAFKKAMEGKTILDARQQGKYFYMVCDSPPHPVMHLGMTGWMRFQNDDSSYYKPEKEKPEDKEWPPRFWKFILQCENKAGEKTEAAFVDARRLARIRLVDAPGDTLRQQSPLKENGPDPVIDKDILTAEWLTNKMRSKHVPVKSLLLDQAVMSGVGNWVADEVLYQASLHPEQYSNTFSDQQIQDLHKALSHVTTTAVETMSDQSKFPENWIMKYRWDKGKKDSNILPNGEKITHLKVGGRTSAIVLSRQKKTGATAAGVDKAEAEADTKEVDEDTATETKGRGRKRKSNDVKEEPLEDDKPPSKRAKKAKSKKSQEAEKVQDKMEPDSIAGLPQKDKRSKSVKASNHSKAEIISEQDSSSGRRRSTRLRN